VHKKPKRKKVKKKSNTCNQSHISPQKRQINTCSMIAFTSPKNRRIEPSLSREMLNSCVEVNNNVSPCFSSKKRSVFTTDKRNPELRRYLMPSNSINTISVNNRLEKSSTDSYYAKFEKKKNSSIPTMHHTPLQTRKTKIYEMNQRSRAKVVEKGLVQSFRPISSMKSACTTVSKPKRHISRSHAMNTPNESRRVSGQSSRIIPHTPKISVTRSKKLANYLGNRDAEH
jgi:hypothetical protein